MMEKAMKIKTSAWVLAASLAAATLLGHEPAAKKTSAEEVAEVLRMNAAAFENGDLAAADRLWAHHQNVSVFESGHANYGWEDYRDHHLKVEIEEMKNVNYKLSDIKAKVSSDTAWATFKYTISADFRGQKIDSGGLGTAVLEKQSDGWKIVHWHTSAPRRPPPVKQ